MYLSKSRNIISFIWPTCTCTSPSRDIIEYVRPSSRTSFLTYRILSTGRMTSSYVIHLPLVFMISSKLRNLSSSIYSTNILAPPARHTIEYRRPSSWTSFWMYRILSTGKMFPSYVIVAGIFDCRVRLRIVV
jgi:hypothetical protein